jgi:ATP-binding cassette subfamily B protein
MKKNSSSRDLWLFMWFFFRQNLVSFLFLLLISFTWSFDSTLWPYTLRLIVDTLTVHESARETIFSSLKVPICYGLSLWLLIEIGYRTQGFLLARFLPKFESSIRMVLFDHIQKHSPSYFNKYMAGSLTNKITDMTTHATSALWQFLYSIFPAFGTFLVSLYFYSTINLFFTATLCILVAAYVCICLIFSKKCMKKEQDHAEARSLLLGKILDSFYNTFTVNLLYRFRQEKLYIQHYQNIEMRKQLEAKKYVELMRMCLSLTFLTGGVVINGFMLFLWKKGSLSTGEIVQVFNMTWNIILILWYAGAEIPSLFQSIGILKQALTVLHDPQDINDTPQTLDLIIDQGQITFNRVCFDYDTKELFHDLSITIKGGEKVGLVGYSGAGKSTFVNLILRLFSIKSGAILIDQQDISQVSLDSLRKQIAFIPQDPMLFHRSIEENIQYGNEQASLEKIQAIASMAACDGFIESSSSGYKTLVGERGSKLSGGERQRIAIARAMLSDSPIIILDEATSALDSESERLVQDALDKLMKGRTSIVIAHRLSTIRNADNILVLQHGDILESGTHQELIEKKGLYADLVALQTMEG